MDNRSLQQKEDLDTEYLDEYLNSYEYYEALIRSKEINSHNWALLLHIDDEIFRLAKRFRSQRIKKLLGKI